MTYYRFTEEYVAPLGARHPKGTIMELDQVTYDEMAKLDPAPELEALDDNDPGITHRQKTTVQPTEAAAPLEHGTGSGSSDSGSVAAPLE